MSEDAMEYFPSWRYHRDKKPVMVKNAEEDEALGPGWEDSPAKFKAEKQKKEAEQAGIQHRYHERFDAARNDGDQQGQILREYASSYPEVASTDPWYSRMSSLIPALQVRPEATDTAKELRRPSVQAKRRNKGGRPKGKGNEDLLKRNEFIAAKKRLALKSPQICRELDVAGFPTPGEDWPPKWEVSYRKDVYRERIYSIIADAVKKLG